MRYRFSLIWLLCTLFFGMLIAPGQPATATIDERQSAFAWFSTLGFPDVKDKKLVRVATGRWYQAGDDPPRNTYLRGFLIDEHDDRFTVLTLSLSTETFQKTAADVVAHKRVSYEIIDLGTAAAACLSPPAADGTSEARPLWDVGLPSRTGTFVLAWACWRNKLDKLAADLFDHAAKMPPGFGRDANKPPVRPLRQLVAEDLGGMEMWRAVVDFGDPAISRVQLSERFDRIVKNYPESEHFKRAKETAALLHQML